MTGFVSNFLLSLALSGAAAVGALWLGGRVMHSPTFRDLGARAHAKKVRGLQSLWPLTLIRPAAARGDVRTVITVITALVALKSAASLFFGLVAVFWLPLASLLVPAIVAAEDPDDPVLLASVMGVARSQVASHVLAAALGFAIMVAGPLAGRPVAAVVLENVWLVVAALLGSAGFAIVAGRREALGVVHRVVSGSGPRRAER